MRLSCILLVEWQTSIGINDIAEETVLQAWNGSNLCASYDEARKKLKTMCERGGFYRHLEGRFGKGICLVLGNSLPESQ